MSMMNKNKIRPPRRVGGNRQGSATAGVQNVSKTVEEEACYIRDYG